jgi:hypothetical protein
MYLIEGLRLATRMNFDEDVVKVHHSVFAGQNIKWHSGKQFGIFFKKM